MRLTPIVCFAFCNLIYSQQPSQGNGLKPTRVDFDELTVFNRALSAAEVSALMNNGINGLNGIIAHYSFDGNTQDSSGNGNHLTAVGNPGFIAGHSGQGISLDGVDDVLWCPKLLNSLPYSISWWMKGPVLQQATQKSLIVQCDSPGVRLSPNILIDGPGPSTAEPIKFDIYQEGSAALSPPINATMLQNWIHVVCVSDLNVKNIYLNGQPGSSGVTAQFGQDCPFFVVGGDIRQGITPPTNSQQQQQQTPPQQQQQQTPPQQQQQQTPPQQQQQQTPPQQQQQQGWGISSTNRIHSIVRGRGVTKTLRTRFNKKTGKIEVANGIFSRGGFLRTSDGSGINKRLLLRGYR